MGRALTIFIFSALLLQASISVPFHTPVREMAEQVKTEMGDSGDAPASDTSEENSREAEVPVEESEACHVPPSAMLPVLHPESMDNRFTDLSLSPVAAPVLDEHKPPPQA